MKKLTFATAVALFFILVFHSNAISQSFCNDALKLKDLLRNGIWPTDDPDVVFILRKYLNVDETVESQFHQNNPFTKKYFSGVWPSASAGPLSSFVSSFGSLDVTTYADGFAKFLVSRTKEELSVAFFKRFKELINKPEYKDARILFPQTSALLNAIDKQIYHYSMYISALREAFEKDLNTLPFALRKIIDEEHQEFFRNHGDVKAILYSAVHVGSGLQKKDHPGSIIANYETSYLDGIKNKDIKGAVSTLQLFSESFRSLGTDHYWIDKDSLQLLLQDQAALRIYLGLIYQKAGDIRFNKTNLKDVLSVIADDWDTANEKLNGVQAYLKALNANTTIITDAIKKLEKKDPDKLTFTDYYAYYNAVLELVDYASETVKLLRVANDSLILTKVNEFTSSARIGGDIALDIARKNYSSAIFNIYRLYGVKIEETSFGDESPLVKSFILTYGSFIAAMAQAQNSDDVQKAIETAALPAGSSSIKRNSYFDLSLNSYGGLFLGLERIEGFDKKRNNFTAGVTAPIGLALSTSFCEGWSISLFGSLVDLGAIFAFRFDNQTDDIPTVQLKDIVSPGVFLSLGFKDVPISCNVGWQTGPNLRKVTVTRNTYEQYDRISLSICVDIPLLTFYNVPNN